MQTQKATGCTIARRVMSGLCCIATLTLSACGAAKGKPTTTGKTAITTAAVTTTTTPGATAPRASVKPSDNRSSRSTTTGRAATATRAVKTTGGKGTTTGRAATMTKSTTSSTAAVRKTTIPSNLTPEEKKDYAFLQKTLYPAYLLTGSAAPGFTGRWFSKEIDGKPHQVTLNDGSECYFLVNGASAVRINFTVITKGKTPYFAYSIDGAAPRRQHITEPTVKLPDKNRHTVRIICDGMTESEGKWVDEIGFALAGVASAGGTIKGIRPQNRVIAFYGDSITEGILALGGGADSDGNSATNAYPWHCAAKLGAIAHFVGFGATGITAQGSFSTFRNAIDYLSLGREVDPGFKPDLIVINHGTNDSDVSSADFCHRLNENIEHLQETYPGVTVVYMIPFNQSHSADIRSTMKAFKNTAVVETKGWNLSYTDGVHPTATGAVTAGTNLANAITSIVGSAFFG